MPRKDQKFERARREMKRQQLTRLANLDAMEKRLRAHIQAKRSRPAGCPDRIGGTGMKRMRVRTSQLTERRLEGDLKTLPYYINTSLWGCLHPYRMVGSDLRKGYDWRPVAPPERRKA